MMSGFARRALCLVLAFSFGGSTSLAWGPQGHRVITRVATARLTPKAKAAINDLLNPGDTLVDVCEWADHEGHDVVRGSGPWHFVNVPIDAVRYDEKYCSNTGCVVSKIHEYRKILADPRTPRRERQLALLFLVHFIEDVHQPLHVGDHRDQGGNDTQVQFDGEGTNLHRLWDSGLIRHIGGNDRDWVERITPRLTPEHVEEWSAGKVEDWATESLEAARIAYHYPRKDSPPLPARVRPGIKLGEDYVRTAGPILEDRMARAAVRLANELNAIFK